MAWSARLRAKVNKVGGIDIPLFKVQTLKLSKFQRQHQHKRRQEASCKCARAFNLEVEGNVEWIE